MAQRQVTIMTDDIDGSEAKHSIEFAYKGKSYRIDLNDTHAEELDEVLAPYISAATESSRGSGGRASRSGGSPRSRASSGSGDVDPKQVRAWAEANGVDVSPRGRISASVIEQYRASGA
jgi:hypothetical protein